MKDSQKLKKAKKESKKTLHKVLAQSVEKSSSNTDTSQQHNPIGSVYAKLKKRFVYIVAGVTVVNLILGIVIVYFIGQIQRTVLGTDVSSENVPALPVVSNHQQLLISAESYIVYDRDSHAVIFEKNKDLRFSPASTTKIMTALVALEYYKLQDVLSADNVHTVVGSKMGLEDGELMTVHDLLYGLMLPSGNDAAYVLAIHYPGGMKGFVARMNQKAQELKLYNTRFIDPAGLDDGNFTTAFDLVRLALVALQNPTFKQVVETKNKVVFDTTYSHVHNLENLNELLQKSGVFGVKTGYTEEAGEVLVTSFSQKGRTYIIAVLKSENRFADTERILNEVIAKIQLVTF